MQREGGVGFLGLLALVFITLRLCGVVDWSWWVVTLPLWGPLALVIAGALVLGIIVGLVIAVMGLVELLKRRMK